MRSAAYQQGSIISPILRVVRDQWRHFRPLLVCALGLLTACALGLLLAAKTYPVKSSDYHDERGAVRHTSDWPFQNRKTHLLAAGRGAPWINLADGHELSAAYKGSAELIRALEHNYAQGRALASADFDEDGIPDLVCGYQWSTLGIVTIHRGNVDSIYPNSPDAKRRRAQGVLSGAPFLSPARAFSVPEPVDFVCAGDSTRTVTRISSRQHATEEDSTYSPETATV
ncbi:MAG: FG-GAP repeat protein [Blastocatellia bacterium]